MNRLQHQRNLLQLSGTSLEFCKHHRAVQNLTPQASGAGAKLLGLGVSEQVRHGVVGGIPDITEQPAQARAGSYGLSDVVAQVGRFNSNVGDARFGHVDASALGVDQPPGVRSTPGALADSGCGGAWEAARASARNASILQTDATPPLRVGVVGANRIGMVVTFSAHLFCYGLGHALEDCEDSNVEHLKIALSAAVPLWVEELKRRPLKEVLARAPECAQAVAEKGDVIQFRSKRRGETAEAFNRLAEGVAILSFAPGGVKAFGLHFESRHPEQS